MFVLCVHASEWLVRVGLLIIVRQARGASDTSSGPLQTLFAAGVNGVTTCTWPASSNWPCVSVGGRQQHRATIHGALST